MKYKIYAYTENKWYYVEQFDTQEEAKEFSDEYTKKHKLNTVIEVEDGGSH